MYTTLDTEESNAWPRFENMCNCGELRLTLTRNETAQQSWHVLLLLVCPDLYMEFRLLQSGWWIFVFYNEATHRLPIVEIDRLYIVLSSSVGKANLLSGPLLLRRRSFNPANTLVPRLRSSDYQYHNPKNCITFPPDACSPTQAQA